MIKALVIVNNKTSEIAVKEIKFSKIEYGDTDGNLEINVNDAALLLQKVLNNIAKLPIEKETTN